MFIDHSEWVRYPDVEAYAEARRISVHDAVIELANKGLSHAAFDEYYIDYVEGGWDEGEKV